MGDQPENTDPVISEADNERLMRLTKKELIALTVAGKSSDGTMQLLQIKESEEKIVEMRESLRISDENIDRLREEVEEGNTKLVKALEIQEQNLITAHSKEYGIVLTRIDMYPGVKKDIKRYVLKCSRRDDQGNYILVDGKLTVAYQDANHAMLFIKGYCVTNDRGLAIACSTRWKTSIEQLDPK